MRKIFFWLHLTAGLVAGIIILIMSVTGVLLTYEKQMVQWADTRNLPSIAANTRNRLTIESLLSTVRESRKALPSSVLVQSDPNKPVQMTFGREFVYFDPYTGQQLGVGNPGLRQFFRSVTDWHRWLAMSGDGRATGRSITGAANLAFLVLIVSGLYLWLPRVWTKASIRAIAWFRGGVSGKARDFNWHNVVGIWSSVPLFFIVLGAVVISYPWASNLVYTITGSPVPGAPTEKGNPRAGMAENRQAGTQGDRSQPGQQRGEARETGGGRPGNGGPRPGPFQAAPPVTLSLAGFDGQWREAVAAVSSWKSITLRMPSSERAPVIFTVDGGYAGQPQKRTTLTFDQQSGRLRNKEDFSDLNLGRRVRTWLRFVHTGEFYGIPGQTVAGLASAGGILLVYTGIALSLRRFFAWRERNARRKQTPTAAAA